MEAPDPEDRRAEAWEGISHPAEDLQTEEAEGASLAQGAAEGSSGEENTREAERDAKKWCF